MTYVFSAKSSKFMVKRRYMRLTMDRKQLTVTCSVGAPIAPLPRQATKPAPMPVHVLEKYPVYQGDFV